MPMTQKEKRRRTYLKKLAMEGKEPRYKRDSVLEEFVRIEKSIHPVIKKEEEKPSSLLEQKIKDLENKIISSSSLSAPIAPMKIYPPEYEEYKEINKSLNELKSILKSGGYDPTDYEKQLLQIYDTKHLYNSRRADLEDADILIYLIDLKKQLYNAFIKLKIKFRL